LKKFKVNLIVKQTLPAIERNDN